MNTLAEILMYLSLIVFTLGFVVNSKYIILLSNKIPSGAHWLVYIWLILLFGLAQWFGRSADNTTVTSIDSSAMSQVASIVLAVLVLLVYWGKYYKSSNMSLPFSAFLIFGVLGILTVPISDIPILSLFKASSFVVSVLIAIIAIEVLKKVKRPELLFDIVYIYFVFIALLALIGGVFLPDLTHRSAGGAFGFILKGWPALNSNSLSYVAAVVFVVSLRRVFIKQAFNRQFLYIGVCMVGVICLLLAQGRTSIGSSVIAVLFMSYYLKDMRSLKYVIFFGGISLFVVFLLSGSVGNWTDTVSDYLQRGSTDEQITTLSGRTEAWAISWELFLESPISGYGFYAAGKTLLAPHNAYFTILLNGGLLGFIPWFIGVVASLWYVFRNIKNKLWMSKSKDNAFYIEIMAVLIVQFVRTLTGQDLTVHSYPTLLLLSLVVYVVVRKKIDTSDTGSPINKNKSSEKVINKGADKFPSVTLRK